MKKYWLLVAFPVILLVWWAVNQRQSPVTLHFSTAKRGKIVSTVSTNGKVEPVEWAAASAETPGVVQSVEVHRGQEVKAGQELATLDAASARSDVAAAIAREREARAEFATLSGGGKAQAVANLNDSLISAQAGVKVAEREYETMKRLAEKQAATKLQVQDAKDALDTAQLRLKAMQNQKETLVTASDRTVAEAKLHDAEAGVRLAQHKLALAAIRAPLAGTLYQFDLKLGSYLRAGDLAGYVGKLDRVKVTIYVDEPDLGRIALDLPVTITWDAHPGQKWQGRVNKLPNEVVALGTRTVGEVTTIVDNPNHDLLPGVSVTALVVSKVVDDAIAIPRAALRTLHGATGVFKLKGEEADWTPIKAGISDVSNVQVLSGVDAGDKVTDRIVEPADAELRDHMRVKALVD